MRGDLGLHFVETVEEALLVSLGLDGDERRTGVALAQGSHTEDSTLVPGETTP